MGVLNSFLPRDGEFADQKNCPGVLPRGGGGGGEWSGLELTYTLNNCNLLRVKCLYFCTLKKYTEWQNVVKNKKF